MFAPAVAVGGPVFTIERSAMLPMAEVAVPLLLAPFGSAADDVVAVRTTLPGAFCAVIPTLRAAVPLAAIDGPAQVWLVELPEQVKPPPVALVMAPPLTLMLSAG